MKKLPYRSTEHGIQTSIMDYLQTIGWLVWRNNSGRVRTQTGSFMIIGRPGLPDVFALKDGTLLGIEVKTPTGKVTDIQNVMHEELRNHGATVLVARCLEDVIEFVNHENTY